MAGSNPNDEYLEIDEQEDVPTVQLNDEAGRSLLCHVERSLEIDGDEYLLLVPVDTPIEIFAWDVDEDIDGEEEEEEEVLIDIEDEEIDEIFETAKAVLAEQDLTLNRTALTLTASGNLPESDEEDIITLDIEEDDESPTQEQFQILANFFYEEQEYAICTPFEPLLFFARKNRAGQPELLSPEEFQTVRSQLEGQLFDDME